MLKKSRLKRLKSGSTSNNTFLIEFLIFSTGKLDAQGKWKSFTSMESNSELPPTSNSTPGVKPDDQAKYAVDKVIQSIPGIDLIYFLNIL